MPFVHDAQRLRHRDGFAAGRDVKIGQIVISEVHLLDIQRMIAIVEVERVHTDTAPERGGLAHIDLHIVHAEMLNRTGETPFKLHSVRHFEHRTCERANIGKHNVASSDGSVEHDRIHETPEGTETVA